MTEYQSRLKYLLETYAAGISTGAEEKELFGLIDVQGNEKEVKEWLMQIQEITQPLKDFNRKAWEPVLGRILETGRTKLVEMPVRKPLFPWMKVAAAILLAVVAVYLFINRNSSHPVTSPEKNMVTHDVAPGGNKAVLTLSNGSTIVLDSAHLGSIAQQGGVTILKTDSGKLAYNILHERPTALLYNTLATPKGGQYQLVLPDGSKVWLNAASSIKYPIAFIHKERIVEIKGEAYFEVKHDANWPFKVKAGKQIIEDIGTAFNVNAYTDESAVKTTLLEGKVKVSIVNGQSSILKPGEQAVASARSSLTIDHSPDLEQVMAWKNGLFSFKGADLQTVLRQLSRWYDIDVIYQGEAPRRRFSGEIGKMLTLDQVLKMLTQNQVHYSIENKRLIIRP